jgi:hypothetical protein
MLDIIGKGSGFLIPACSFSSPLSLVAFGSSPALNLAAVILTVRLDAGRIRIQQEIANLGYRTPSQKTSAGDSLSGPGIVRKPSPNWAG